MHWSLCTKIGTYIYFKVLFKRQFALLVLIPLNSLHCYFLLVLVFSLSFCFQATEECLSPTNGKYISNYNVPPHIITKIAESLSYNDFLIFFWRHQVCAVLSLPYQCFHLSIHIILQLTVSYSCHFSTHTFLIPSKTDTFLVFLNECFSACNDFSKTIAKSSVSLLTNFLKTLTCVFKFSKWLFPQCKTVFNQFLIMHFSILAFPPHQFKKQSILDLVYF